MQSQEIAMPVYPTSAQTSSPYSRTGKHLGFNSSSITCSESSLQTLAKIPFSARKNERFAWSTEHLNLVDRTINMPRYLTDACYNKTEIPTIIQ